MPRARVHGSTGPSWRCFYLYSVVLNDEYRRHPVLSWPRMCALLTVPQRTMRNANATSDSMLVRHKERERKPYTSTAFSFFFFFFSPSSSEMWCVCSSSSRGHSIQSTVQGERSSFLSFYSVRQAQWRAVRGERGSEQLARGRREGVRMREGGRRFPRAPRRFSCADVHMQMQQQQPLLLCARTERSMPA